MRRRRRRRRREEEEEEEDEEEGGGSGRREEEEDGEYKIEVLWVHCTVYGCGHSALQAHSMEFSPKWQVNGGMKHNHALR